MLYFPQDDARGARSVARTGSSVDSETAALMRSFILPLLQSAQSWSELTSALEAKGFGLAFLDGRLVIVGASDGRPLCTGSHLGAPLRELAERLGRPTIRATRDGRSGNLAG